MKSTIYHENAMRFLRRRNRPKEIQPKKAPLPKLKAGWQMPTHPEVYCMCCKERMRPMAYNDSGEIHLSIGCRCDSLSFIEEIEWPFVDEYIHRSREALEIIGFEHLWG